jgi:hypothetical protein
MKSQPLRAKGRRAGRIAMPQANWFSRLIVQVRRTLHVPIQSAAPDLTCEQVVGLIADYLTGALDPETTDAFEEHLRACDNCIAFLNTYKRTITAVRLLRFEDIPADMQVRVRDFLELRTRRSDDDLWPPAGSSQPLIYRLFPLLRRLLRHSQHTRMLVVPFLTVWIF